MTEYPTYEFISRKRVRLLEDWVTDFGTVPKGFESDGASVPRPFRWLISPLGDLFEAAIFHDFCYDNAIETKEYADRYFKYIALDFGAPTWKAELAYFFVKHFGKGSY